jgi:hypothetical protein
MAVEHRIRVMQSATQALYRRNGETRPGWWLRLVLALLLAGGGLGGCGVKGPPVPLRPQARLPAVTDLAYRVADHSVMLTWTLSPLLDGKAAKQASFIVRRSQTALDAPACENCPLVFEKVGTVPYVDAGDKPFALSLALETGHRYVFTVYLKMGGMKGPESNPVKFDYTSDEFVVPVEEP